MSSRPEGIFWFSIFRFRTVGCDRSIDFICTAVCLGWPALLTGEKQAYKYLGASIEKFPSGEEMCALMEASGFSDAQAQPLSGGIVTIYCARKPQ